MAGDAALVRETISCPDCAEPFIPAPTNAHAKKELPANILVCPCDSCSKPVGFDPEKLDEGMTVTCPHCGADTVLFNPQNSDPSTLDSRPKQGGSSLWPGYTIVTTSNSIEGYRILNYMGLVRGIVVRSPNLEQQIFGGLKTIVGGDIESYARVCEAARDTALRRMLKHAHKVNADAVIGFRYDATEFGPGITEVLAYGTAVKLEKSALP
jgi:uncharacterized protein YbjQ (UPF0145 family)